MAVNVAKVKRNLFDTQRQLSRYNQLSKSNTLANRLNRILPSNTNFPDSYIRERGASTALDTSKGFKLHDAEKAFNDPATSQSFQDESCMKDSLVAVNQQNEY